MDHAAEYEIGGRRLRCQHCAGARFHHRSATVSGAALSLLSLEWAAPQADVYVCAACGHMHWFQSPQATEVEDVARCLSCGARMREGSDTCRACGWSYRES